MPLSIETLGEIDRVVGQWCLHMAPVHIKAQLDYDYEVDGQAVTIFEVRPLWRGQHGEKTRSPFAKFRYYKSRQTWQIYWMRASGKWEAYEPDPTARNLERAVAIVDADKYGCFFG
ncbi:MAG: hypothetical protein RJB14_2995 [Pseudomonadota bacterium]|jgi:hypothetical protein